VGEGGDGGQALAWERDRTSKRSCTLYAVRSTLYVVSCTGGIGWGFEAKLALPQGAVNAMGRPLNTDPQWVYF